MDGVATKTFLALDHTLFSSAHSFAFIMGYKMPMYHPSDVRHFPNYVKCGPDLLKYDTGAGVRIDSLEVIRVR